MKYMLLILIAFNCYGYQVDETNMLFSAEDYAQERHVQRIKPHKEVNKVIVVTQEELDRVLKPTKEGSK